MHFVPLDHALCGIEPEECTRIIRCPGLPYQDAISEREASVSGEDRVEGGGTCGGGEAAVDGGGAGAGLGCGWGDGGG